jgi:hypothetical protein
LEHGETFLQQERGHRDWFVLPGVCPPPSTSKGRFRAHPTQLKQLGRHANYATLGAYLEEGDLFEDNALEGVL